MIHNLITMFNDLLYFLESYSEYCIEHHIF
jgi:hypothetical protein